MINYKDCIADILVEVIDGIDRDEITQMIEMPSDDTMGDYAFHASDWQKH